MASKAITGLLEASRSMLLIVDVQEKLAPAMPDLDRLVDRLHAMIDAARLMSVPIAVTEHCPDRIGRTLESLITRGESIAILPKTHFCATREPEIVDGFNALGRKQIVVCGVEAHVCVLQTVIGLIGEGYECFVLADAVSSRHDQDRQVALQRLQGHGVQIVTTEMVIFEWLERGDDDRFRDALKIVKAR